MAKTGGQSRGSINYARRSEGSVAERDSEAAEVGSTERGQYARFITNSLDGSGAEARDTHWGLGAISDATIICEPDSIDGEEGTETVSYRMQHETVERAAEGGARRTIRRHKSGDEFVGSERLLREQRSIRCVFSRQLSSKLSGIDGDSLEEPVLPIPEPALWMAGVASDIHKDDGKFGRLLEEQGSQDKRILRRSLPFRPVLGTVSASARIPHKGDERAGLLSRSEQGEPAANSEGHGVGFFHRHHDAFVVHSGREDAEDFGTRPIVPSESFHHGSEIIRNGLSDGVLSARVTTDSDSEPFVVPELQRSIDLGRRVVALRGEPEGSAVGDFDPSKAQRSSLQLGTGKDSARRDRRIGLRMVSALGRSGDSHIVSRSEGAVERGDEPDAFECERVDGAIQSDRLAGESYRPWQGNRLPHRQRNVSSVSASGWGPDSRTVRDSSVDLGRSDGFGSGDPATSTHSWEGQLSSGFRFESVRPGELGVAPRKIRRTEPIMGPSSNRSIREQHQLEVRAIQFDVPVSGLGGGRRIQRKLGHGQQLLVPAVLDDPKSTREDRVGTSVGSAHPALSSIGRVVAAGRGPNARAPLAAGSVRLQGRDRRVDRAARAVSDAVGGAQDGAEAERRVASAIIGLAWETTTNERYDPIVHEFESRFGAIADSNERQIVPDLLQFASGFIISGRNSQAKVVIAAVARDVGLKRGIRVYDDARVKAFSKGLEKYKNLQQPPKPKRDPLPAEAVVEYAKLGLETNNRKIVTICAIISLGIRCIRRPGELADLREDQLEAADFGARLRLVLSKNDPTAQGLSIPFERGVTPACPVLCLDRYLRLVKGVPLSQWQSRRQDLHLFVNEAGRPFSADAIKDMVRLVAKRANLTGQFGGHSLRITGACLAILGGMTLEQVMSIGGWKSRAVETYLRGMVAVAESASKRMGL